MANIIVLKNDTSSQIRRTNSNATSMISNILRSCLGPRAYHKLILTKIGSLELTNDGNSILRELDIAHPATKALIEIAKTQDETVGDGTTSVILLASKIFSNLIELDYHPILMSHTFPRIQEFILKKIDEIKLEVKSEEAIKSIVSQSVNTKMCTIFNIDIPKLAIEASAVPDIKNLRIEKILDTDYENSKVLKGFALSKLIYHPQMRTKIEAPKILIIENGIEYVKGASQTQMEFMNEDDFEKAHSIEEKVVEEQIAHILELSPDIVVCEKGITDFALSMFASNNITAIRRLTKTETNRLALATGAKIVTRALDAATEDFGTCGIFEFKKVGNTDFCVFDNCEDPQSLSVFLNGASKDILNELERNFFDALKVAKNLQQNKFLVPGGGAFEMFVSQQIKSYEGTQMEKDVAEKIADSFKIIPECLIKNSGVEEPLEVMAKLEAANKENKFVGVNGINGELEDMTKIVLESCLVKEQSIKSAVEAVSLLLRVDGIIKSKVVD